MPISDNRKIMKTSSGKYKIVPEKSIRTINIILTILFYMFILLFMGIYKLDFLFKAQELSLFLFEKDFFQEFMLIPGGLLGYTGCFFTQFFYYPWLGLLIFMLMLALIQFLIIKIFRFSPHFYFLSFIPPALLLLFVTQIDYLLFIMKSQGFIYSQLIGILCVLLSITGFRLIPSFKLKATFIFIYTALFYPLLGFYALFSVVLISIDTLFVLSNKLRLVLILETIFIITVIPLLSYYFLYDHLNYDYRLISGLPFPIDFKEAWYFWLPLIGIFLFLFISIIFRKNAEEAKKNTITGYIYINIVSLFLIMGIVFLFSNRDSNFHRLLAMSNALEQNDWDKMLSLAKQSENTPTRLIVLHRNLALFRKNELCDKMFTYPDGFTLLKTDSNISPAQVSSYSLFYHYGQIGYANRWMMESMVRNGVKAEYLKYMTKISLFNNETDLAKKYLGQLKHTLFHKKWAEKYEKYTTGNLSFTEDIDYKNISPTMQYENFLGGTSSALEEYLLEFYAYLKSGTPVMGELSMATSLTLKDINGFWPKFFLYEKNKWKMPVHVQEAALLFTTMEGKINISQIKFNATVVNRFKEFVNEANAYKNIGDENNMSTFKNKFGDTYWFYYFFIKDNNHAKQQ